MTKTTKTTILSVLCLVIISIVTVGILSVANHYLKYVPVLDEKTCNIINKICPSGVDDATAFSENYFELISDENLEKEFSIKLKDFNKENGSSFKQVLAVYRCIKGDNSGKFIIESKAKGYVDSIVMITLIGDDGSVSNTDVKAQSESIPYFFSGEYFQKFVEWSKGRKDFTADGIHASTGATTKVTLTGVADAMDIAVKMGEKLVGGGN